MGDGVEIDVIEARARRVKDDRALCVRLASAYATTRGGPHPVTGALEERLYDGLRVRTTKLTWSAPHDATAGRRRWPSSGDFDVTNDYGCSALRVDVLRGATTFGPGYLASTSSAPWPSVWWMRDGAVSTLEQGLRSDRRDVN